MIVHPIKGSRFKDIRPHPNNPLPRTCTGLRGQFGNAIAKISESLRQELCVAATPFHKVFIRMPAIHIGPDQSLVRLPTLENDFAERRVNSFMVGNFEDYDGRAESLNHLGAI